MAAGNGTVSVFAGNARLAVPATARSFVERLTRRRHFSAGDALNWTEGTGRLSWAEVREALDALLGRGVIRRRPRRASAGDGRPPRRPPAAARW